MSPVKSFALALTFLSMIGNPVLAETPGVREIPLPADAADVTYVRRRGDIRLTVPTEMKAAGNFYAAALAERQWTKSKKDNLQKNFWVQSFTKQGLTLEVRVDQRASGCEIRLTPEGFAWDEDLAPRPKDLPIPEDAKELKYDDFFERIEFQSAAAPELLAEFYAGKLDPKTWSKSGTDTVTAGTVRLERTAGKASVAVAVRKERDGSAVTISTKGMVWDEIKAANDAVKQAAEKVAERNTPDPKKPLLTRDSSPAKRLANAPQLPNAGKLTIGGKTHSLAHVTVYETQQFDSVVTAVLLTERPINLAKLKASLAKPERNDDDFNEFQPQIKLMIDAREQVSGISIWCDGLSLSGSGWDNLQATVAIEDGRARGTAKTTESGDAFGKKVDFDLSFDASVLPLPAAKK